MIEAPGASAVDFVLVTLVPAKGFQGPISMWYRGGGGGGVACIHNTQKGFCLIRYSIHTTKMGFYNILVLTYPYVNIIRFSVSLDWI